MTTLYTPHEVADRLKVNIATIQKALKDGRIQGVRMGKLWRIPQAELDRLAVEGMPTRGQHVAAV